MGVLTSSQEQNRKPERPESKEDSLLFLEALNAFQEVAGNSGSLVHHFLSVGGYTVELQFAGQILPQYVVPALAHLTAQPVSNPDLTVCLWDGLSTKRRFIPSLEEEGFPSAAGKIRGHHGDRFYSVYDLGTNIFSMLDSYQGLSLVWICDPHQLPQYERSAPLRNVLHRWMGDHGRQMTHAAAMGLSTGGVLLVGKGGSGKSTSALACLQSGLKIAGDDYCLVTTEKEPYVFSLYNSVKLNHDSLARFPHLLPYTNNQERMTSEKALFFLNENFPDQISTGFPLSAVLVARITGGTASWLEPISPSEALLALAPSSILQLDWAGGKDFRALAKLVKSVPCYDFHLGTKISEIPAALSSLLSGSQAGIL